MLIPNTHYYPTNLQGTILSFISTPRRGKIYAVIQLKYGYKYIIPATTTMALEKILDFASTRYLGTFHPIGLLPNNTRICNILNMRTSLPQYACAPGTMAQLKKTRTKTTACLILPSKKRIYLNINTLCQLGQNMNILHSTHNYGSAGVCRHVGLHPTTRNMAMNAHLHYVRVNRPLKNRKQLPWYHKK